MKRRVFILLGLCAVVIWAAVLALPDKNLHVIFCDVGQGDATLMVWGRVQILIDGGPDLAVLECLARYVPFFDKQIEVVVVTHGHDDHTTGLISVIERYSVKHFVRAKTAAVSAELDDLQRIADERKVATTKMAAGDELVFSRKDRSELRVKVLWPPQSAGEVTYARNLNLGSVVAEVEWGWFSALVTGDADAEVEKEMDLTGDVQQVEVLKVPHHGSRTGLDADYVRQVKPDLAVISVGKNSYGHPASETIQLLQTMGTEIKRTDTDGDIEVISDGKTWWVR